MQKDYQPPLREDAPNMNPDIADAVAEVVSAKVAEALASLWKRDFELLRHDVEQTLAQSARAATSSASPPTSCIGDLAPRGDASRFKKRPPKPGSRLMLKASGREVKRCKSDLSHADPAMGPTFSGGSDGASSPSETVYGLDVQDDGPRVFRSSSRQSDRSVAMARTGSRPVDSLQTQHPVVADMLNKELKSWKSADRMGATASDGGLSARSPSVVQVPSHQDIPNVPDEAEGPELFKKRLSKGPRTLDDLMPVERGAQLLERTERSGCKNHPAEIPGEKVEKMEKVNSMQKVNSMSQRIVSYMLTKELKSWNGGPPPLPMMSMRSEKSMMSLEPACGASVFNGGQDMADLDDLNSAVDKDSPRLTVSQARRQAKERFRQALEEPDGGSMDSLTDSCPFQSTEPDDTKEDLGRSPKEQVDTGEVLQRSRSSIRRHTATIDDIMQATNEYWISDIQKNLKVEDVGETDEEWGLIACKCLYARAVLRGLINRFLIVLPRVCGLLPWSWKHKRLAMAYQMSVILLVASTMVARWMLSYGREHEPHHTTFCDTVLGVGSLVTLIVCFCMRQSLYSCDHMLAKNAVEAKLTDIVSWLSITTVAETVAVLVIASVLRIHLAFQQDSDFVAALSRSSQFVLSSFILLSMTVYFRGVVQFLLKSVDLYCCDTFSQVNLAQAELRWNLVQAVVRTSCTSMDRCFFLTQLTGAVALISMAGIVDALRDDLALENILCTLPGILVGLGITKALLHAAALTDKCDRVPSIFAFLPTGKELDINRVHLVQHIVNSQPGFYCMGVRLSSAVVLKLIYLTCVLTVAIGTNMGS